MGSGTHPAFYAMGNRDNFLGIKGMKLNTHLNLALRSRMCGSIPPLPQYPSTIKYGRLKS
jgi:hypothetical protein